MARAHQTELPAAERAAHYRRMAEDAEAMGDGGTREFRAACASFAMRWRTLADDVESGRLKSFEDTEQDLARRRLGKTGPSNVIVASEWAARQSRQQ